MFCKNCGSEIDPNAKVCENCGTAVDNEVVGTKSKIVAGLLGIFLGGLGVHNFYLGFNKKAVLQIVISFVTCGIGALWGFIEGILILAGSINTDAEGKLLTN